MTSQKVFGGTSNRSPKEVTLSSTSRNPLCGVSSSSLFPLDKEGFVSDTSHAENRPLFSRSRHLAFRSLKLAFLFTYGLIILSEIYRVFVYVFESRINN